MAIRIKHSGPRAYAEMGTLVSEAKQAERDIMAAQRQAERAEQHSMALQEIGLRREMAGEQLQLKKQLAQDGMAFQREAMYTRNKFELNKQLVREQHDFDIIEMKRLEDYREEESALNAINSSDELSPEEKEKLTILYKNNKAGGGSGMAGALFRPKKYEPTQEEIQATQDAKIEDRRLLQQNRLIGGIKNLQAEVKKKIDFIGQFNKKSTKWGFGAKIVTRTMGKRTRKATSVEIQEYNDSLKNVTLYKQEISRMNKELQDGAVLQLPVEDDKQLAADDKAVTQDATQDAINNKQSYERAKEISLITPQTEEEAVSLLQEMAQINPKAAQALNDQWGRLNFNKKRHSFVSKNMSQSMSSFK